MKPRILFLVSSDYESLKRKGVADMILERDEGGFFDRVITVHPFTAKNQTIVLNKSHIIYEFGIWPQFLLKKKGVLKYLSYPFQILKILLPLKKIVKNEGIQIIRATDPYFMGLIGWILSKISKIPFCISVHVDYLKMLQLDAFNSFKKNKLTIKILTLLERFIYRKAELVMPISKYLSNQITQKLGNSCNICVIPHGIDTSFKKNADKNNWFE